MSAEEKTRIVVDIYGIPYKIVASTSPAYIKKIAAMVNNQMVQISEKDPRLDTPRIAVLAAVNAFDDALTMRDKLENLEHEYKNKLREQAGYAKTCRQKLKNWTRKNWICPSSWNSRGSR
ncbi:cell division protein ZapA [Paenibacillus larvae]|nr:cell division protein ZapA [Paenibacillus larvae]MDT2239218.1 cell division protein ZapA [Paenibacillus larvae]